uniref:Ig-like domain-containing protein n=1 Tax=Scleropages formosus TaxID=113540 RepID=A0A8C9R2Z8_SCLFO
MFLQSIACEILLIQLKFSLSDGPKKTSVSASPSGAMVEGSSVTLTCNSKASPPVDTYTCSGCGCTPNMLLLMLCPNVAVIQCCNCKKSSVAKKFKLKYSLSDSPKNTSVSVSPSGNIVEGNSVTLTCNSKANPPVDTYIWFKRNGAEISQRGSRKGYYITNITSEDSGQYYCVATNGQGTGTSTLYTVNVQYSPKNISVSVSPSGDIVEGSSVTLACNSKANPPVDIYTWFKKNGTELSLRGTAQNYIIIDIRPLDSGEYYCEAKNKYGTANSTAVSVNVVCK